MKRLSQLTLLFVLATSLSLPLSSRADPLPLPPKEREAPAKKKDKKDKADKADKQDKKDAKDKKDTESRPRS